MAVPEDSVLFPKTTPSLTNVTVPVAPALLTLAVNVTDWPNELWSCDDNNVVVVAAFAGVIHQRFEHEVIRTLDGDGEPLNEAHHRT